VSLVNLPCFVFLMLHNPYVRLSACMLHSSNFDSDILFLLGYSAGGWCSFAGDNPFATCSTFHLLDHSRLGYCWSECYIFSTTWSLSVFRDPTVTNSCLSWYADAVLRDTEKDMLHMSEFILQNIIFLSCSNVVTSFICFSWLLECACLAVISKVWSVNFWRRHLETA
jgi:hypothetical protein